MDIYQRAADFLNEHFKAAISTYPYSVNQVNDYIHSFQSRFSAQALSEIPDSQVLDQIFSLDSKSSMMSELILEGKAVSASLGYCGGPRYPKHYPFRKDKSYGYLLGTGMPFSEPEPFGKETAKKLSVSYLHLLIECIQYIERHSFDTLEDYSSFEETVLKLLGSQGTYGWAHKFFHLIYPELFTELHALNYRKSIVKALGIDAADFPYGWDWQLGQVRKCMGSAHPFAFARTIYSIPEIMRATKADNKSIHSVFDMIIVKNGQFGYWNINSPYAQFLFSPDTHDGYIIPLPSGADLFFKSDKHSDSRQINVLFEKNDYTCFLGSDSNNVYHLSLDPSLYSEIEALFPSSSLDSILSMEKKDPNHYVLFFIPLGTNEKSAKGVTISIPDDEEEQFHQARSLKDNQLEKLALERSSNQSASSDHNFANSNTKTVSVQQRYRDPYIAEYTKRKANGFCQLCGNPAPFLDSDNRPYLESHHIVFLSEGGEDSLLNTVALCPNCHRKMHIVKDSNDILKLKALAEQDMTE